MPIDPGSTKRLLPESSSHGRYGKDMVIVHSTGTTATAASNARYFAREDVQVESHFIIGYSAVDPTLQVMDTDAKADANGDANRRGISIEVVGTGDEAFTPWQISELIRIGRWAHKAHGVPLRETPSEDEGGYAWHVKYGAPGPWTSVRGKVCPGRRRVEQLQRIIFPAIFTGATTQQEEPRMFHIVKDGIHHHVWDGFHDPVWIRSTMVLGKLNPALSGLPRINMTRAEFDQFVGELNASRREWPNYPDDVAERAARRTTAWLANPTYNPGTVIDGAARNALTKISALVEDDELDAEQTIEALRATVREALAEKEITVTLGGPQ